MIQKLIDSIVNKDAPIVVGLDPMMKYIPQHIKSDAFSQYGESLEGAAEAVWQYNKALIDAIYDLVPAVKPQIAMYEQFGIPGLAAFNKTNEYARQKGLFVIGDIKRGDIGSTSGAYASAHIGNVLVGNTVCEGFHEDFVTVNPYFGTDGVKPFIDECNKNDRGIFLLVKTSNPSSGELQDREIVLEDGTHLPLYEQVGRTVAAWAAESMDGSYSNVGAVVGATYPEMGKALREIMPHSYILVPGYGAQGGKGADLVHFFNEDGLGAIINSSRGIIAAYQNDAYKDRFDETNFADAARQAVLDMKKDIKSALSSK